MKKYFFISGLLALASCSSEQLDEVSNEYLKNEDVKTEQVSKFSETEFSFGGEYITESETTLGSRASDEVIYYAFDIDSVEVVSVEYKGVLNTDTLYHHYAEGLFTSFEKMKLHLPKGFTYRINAAVVKEVGDEVYHEGNTYYAPFCASINNGGVELKNAFVVTKESNYNLDQVWINTNDKNSFKIHPMIDRYFGSMFFTPDKDKESVNIDMTRFAFGLKITVTPPTDGEIKLTCSAPELEYTVKSTDSTLEIDNIYATNTTSDTYRRNSEYEDIVYLKIVWNRETEEDITIDKEIKIKKNIKKILNINLNNRDVESDFGFNLGEEMSEETEEIN